MKLCSRFVLCVCLLVLLCVCDSEQANKKKNKKKQKAAPCKLSAEDLQNNPLRASCSKGLISSISVVGHSGRHCQGLTPDLFVQMNACFWQKKCTLTYDTQALNYMLKLYKGTISDCVHRQLEKFVISYECTSKKVKRLHLLHRGKEERDEVVRDKEGVVVSHGDHPWLYRRRHDLREELTLQKPLRKPKRYKVFMYTIRSLSLMSGDNLTVHWTTDSGTNHSKSFPHDYDLSTPELRTFNISRAVQVVFSFETAVYTNGGEGFVVCFRWSKKVKKSKKVKQSDTCKKLLVQQNCAGKRQTP